MNQILVTKKLYITPELKAKKKMYKFDFFLSIFLICVLFSLYIYAEYDRNKGEEVAQNLLADFNLASESDDTVIKKENNIMVVVLDEGERAAETISVSEVEEEINQNAGSGTQNAAAVETHKASNGEAYSIIGVVNIPKINVNYSILSQTSDTLLKISPCKFWGPNINEVGNFVIVGHNYRNSKFFSKVPSLSKGDIIELTDLSNKKVKYAVYNMYTVDPTDVSCTSQLTGGRREVTLITCTNDSKQRVVVKAREV